MPDNLELLLPLYRKLRLLFGISKSFLSIFLGGLSKIYGFVQGKLKEPEYLYERRMVLK